MKFTSARENFEYKMVNIVEIKSKKEVGVNFNDIHNKYNEE